MKQQNYNYITCYRRKGDDIFIYLKDGSKFKCYICRSLITSRKYLNFPGKLNNFLFNLFKIDKDLLTAKLPGIYYDGDWPESKTEGEIFDLLRSLVKESKIRYYANTEI